MKGPDLWHVACALSVRTKYEVHHFLSLDDKQSAIAKSLGFRVL